VPPGRRHRVWQTLDPVGYLVKIEGQAAPKAIIGPPHGKTRLPAMPEELPSFSWEEVFKYAVAELELANPQQRRERVEEFLERFRQMVGESGSQGSQQPILGRTTRGVAGNVFGA